MRIRLNPVKRLIRHLAEKAAIRSPEPWHEVTVVLTDDAGITPVNKRYFGKPDATDVISFAFDPLPGEAHGLRGEVYVNAERAAQVGREPDGAGRELALYIAHGLNHLSGARDHTPRQRAAMRRRERTWLRRADSLGLLRGLLAKRRRREFRCDFRPASTP